MIIRGTFAKKIYLHLIGLTILLVVLTYAIYYFFDFTVFTWQEVIMLTAAYFMLSIIIYIWDIVRPLSKIIDQIKAVLANRKYKKIYTKRTDEIGILAHFFNEVTESLERVSDELAESKKISGELQTAGQLQKELIPDVAPTIEGFDVAVKNRSAEELGGDNLDFIKVGNSTYFYIGDVTGHGVPAAIVMTMVNTLINAFVEIYDTAYEVVVQTNRRLKKRIRATMFMSMMMMKWDGLKKQMSYVGCGHEHILVYRAKTGQVDCLPSGGIALGMVADNSKIVKESTIDLSAGDVLVLYTDGITEAKNMSGEMFGLHGIKAVLAQYGGQGGAMEIIQNIAREFSKFVEEHVQEDDVTLMVLRKLEEGEEARSFIDQKQQRWSDEQETH
jgi:serine phosphatase RsbU (regulator of sigma subunit)